MDIRKELKRFGDVSLESLPLVALDLSMVPIPGRDFAMCKYQVTQGLWELVMGENPSESKGVFRPVVNVSWDDCQKFLEKLNAKPVIIASGRQYRLPTADEWEFACRAGAAGDYCKLEDGTEITEKTLGEVAWFEDNSGGRTHAVGQKKPNAFGLYDMHGNVWEWTSTVGAYDLITCGGGLHDCANLCEAGSYGGNSLGARNYNLGFRLVSVNLSDAESKVAKAEVAAVRAEAERAEAERAETEMKVAVKTAVSELASSMVSIPGKDYAICKYEVTQALWMAVMGKNPSKYQGPHLPVVSVSWNACQMFLENLNARPEIIASGRQYRFPTVDEWEFACRAGATGDYCKLADGSEITEKTLGEVAWFEDNSGGRIHAVGQKKPNAYGLYDMLGNVLEWTSTDKDGKLVNCGGAENASASGCGSKKRHYADPPDKKYNNVGFRLVSLSEAEYKAAAARAEAEWKAAAKTAMAKLSDEMVPIPSKDYAMSKFEVTQALWLAVMGKKTSKFQGPHQPVVNVSWDDCQKFLEKLNAKPEIIASGRQYRLPTADEWEFACRAGAAGYYCKLEDGTEITEKTLCEVAWFEGNSDGRTHAVGQKKPNAYGLYDMLGNVWEWTSTDEDGKLVNCGGAENASASGCGSKKRRSADPPDKKYNNVGFRLVSLSEAEYKAAAARAEAAAARAESATNIAELASNMVAIPGKSYSICKYQVTQALWKVVMGGNPSKFKGENRPVENVSWKDCQEFLKKLNARPDVKKSGRRYRLPTEDEWHVARHCKLSDGTVINRDTLDKVAWFTANSNHQTHPVGQKMPNAFGLYDMFGNVWEWVLTVGGKVDPSVRGLRTFCGGSWDESWDSCLCKGRYESYSGDRGSDIGFRLAADK